MLPVEMLENVKDHIDAPDNFWSDEIVWRRLSEATKEVVRDISEQDPTFFVQTTDITFVADQPVYDLPVNAGLGTRIIFAENRDNPLGAEISPGRLRDLLEYGNSTSLINLSDSYKFALQGDQVRVIPTPSIGKSAALRVWYVPSYGHMMQGTASAGGASTLTFFASAPNWTTNYGWRDVRNDFFNGMKVMIYDGTSVGDVREITDYTGGSTFQITVDEAWTSTPDTTSKFAILCPIPEQHHQTVCIRAALMCSIKGRTRDKELRSAYYGPLGAPGALKELLSWVSKRQDAKIETVIPFSVGA